MNKPLCIVSSPVDTFSGYGARSRDFIKSLIKAKGDEWDIKLLSQRWGSTPFGFLNDEIEEEADLKSRIIGTGNQMSAQPDVWFQITVPNEFQKVGKHLNIGVTAGIETTICDPSWIEGCNRMDLILGSSTHTKTVFEGSQFEQKDKNTNQTVGILKLTTPVEVLFEGVDLNKYFKSTPPQTDLVKSISSIKEDFCFLFVGHWLQGEFGEDRKNVSYMIKAFLEVFKGKTKAPALILKTNSATTSIMDRNSILEKIEQIRKTVKGIIPNIYLLHGDLEDEDINDLYNHSKVKSMISFTKGEGFGRPLLEFSVIEKPVIASGWSGHIDFLTHESSVLIGGELKEIHKSAQVPNMLIEGSSWFKPDDAQVGHALKEVFENYKTHQTNAKKQASISKNKFSLDKMTERLIQILDEKTQPVPKFIPLELPKLNKIELPKLKKL
jgi:glycosyltransferase involved in cell wall biosynthesis